MRSYLNLMILAAYCIPIILIGVNTWAIKEIVEEDSDKRLSTVTFGLNNITDIANKIIDEGLLIPVIIGGSVLLILVVIALIVLSRGKRLKALLSVVYGIMGKKEKPPEDFGNLLEEGKKRLPSGAKKTIDQVQKMTGTKNTKDTKDTKDKKDTKDTKDTKNTKDTNTKDTNTKDTKNTNTKDTKNTNTKDTKDTNKKDTKDTKNTKETKDTKDAKETKDTKDTKNTKKTKDEK